MPHIKTIADLVAALLRMPQEARVIMSDTHDFESTISGVVVDGDDVLVCGGEPARKYAELLRGRRVELSEEDIAKITAAAPPSPDDYNLEDLDDAGNLRPKRKLSEAQLADLAWQHDAAAAIEAAETPEQRLAWARVVRTAWVDLFGDDGEGFRRNHPEDAALLDAAEKGSE